MSHLNIFGCLVYVHIRKEKRSKLDPSEKKGMFVGYCEVSKFFMIYILGFHHIDISRDVIVDEETVTSIVGCSQLTQNELVVSEITHISVDIK